MGEFKAVKRKGTILFCDIRNFTNLFENEDPLKAISFANGVLGELGEIIEAAGGSVDRFTGDGFLAHFGIESESTTHEMEACKAALGMRKRLSEINSDRYTKLERVVTAGIGIHTGVVAYGEICTKRLSQRTVLGNVVNLASRVESLTNYFSVDVLVTENIYKSTKDVLLFQEMPSKDVKGIREAITTYWLLPMN